MTNVDSPPTSSLMAAGAAFLVAAIAWNLIGNLALPDAWYVPANLVVAAALVAGARAIGLEWGELGLDRKSLGRGALIGLAAAALVALVIGLGLIVPAIESYFEDDGVAEDSTFDRWYVPLVRIPLGTAVFEEVLFRSVLLAVAVRLWGLRRAVASTSILFGLWHVVPAWESSSGSAAATVGVIGATVLITTVAGVLFAVLRVWSGSVLAPVLAHWATNSLSYGAALLALETIE